MQSKNITYQSSKIFYRIAGEGKPVILLHGFGEDGDIWKHQIEYLQSSFKLIIPHLPGSGKSEMIKDMTIEGMAEAIKEIVDIELQFPLQGAEGAEGALPCIIGHSMGGYITLAFAEKYPASLSSFGLFHSSAYADSEEKKAARLKSIEFIKQNGAHAFLKTMIPGLFCLPGQDGSKPSDPLMKQQQIDELLEKGKKFSAEALTAYYNAMIARPDRTHVLKNFLHPVLFIMGEHDKVVPLEQSLPQSHLPKQSQLHILRNSAHMGMLEETLKANKALLDFLSRQPD